MFGSERTHKQGKVIVHPLYEAAATLLGLPE